MGADVLASSGATDGFIIASGVIGILFALYQFHLVGRISLNGVTGTGGSPNGSNRTPLVPAFDTTRLVEIYDAIRAGADSFLLAEYTVCGYFIVGFGVVVLVAVSCEFVIFFSDRHEDTSTDDHKPLAPDSRTTERNATQRNAPPTPPGLFDRVTSSSLSFYGVHPDESLTCYPRSHARGRRSMQERAGEDYSAETPSFPSPTAQG